MSTRRENFPVPFMVLFYAASLVGAPRAAGDTGSNRPSIRSVYRIVTGTTPADPFRSPSGLAVDATRGIFLIADPGRGRLAIFDAKGQCRGTMTLDTGEPGAPSAEPRAVALDRRGHLFVIDGKKPNVQVFTTRGRHLGEVAPANDWGTSTRAQDVAVGASGRLYVLYGGERAGIAILSPNGTLESSLGFEAAEPRAFLGPVSVAVNETETELAVVDPRADRMVLVYSNTGNLLASFGKHGEGEGTFSVAAHVAWGPRNTLWVTDTVRHTIGVYDSRGTYLGWIGGYGNGPGLFYYPAACAFLAPDRIVVLERAGARCQVLGIDVGGESVPDPGLETSVPLQSEHASRTPEVSR